jgi:protein tyrosine/serine phosphatase
MRGAMHWKRLAYAAPLLAGLGFLGVQQWTGNVHTVIEHRLYRSGTLGPAALESLLEREGIRTVINLRGPHVGTPWYDEERAVAERRGADLVDLSWSAGRELSDDMVAAFYKAVGSAKGPILIHCMSGSDRTGLAVALYMAKFAGAGEFAAEEQLSIRYGHFAIPFLSRAYAMNETFERLEPSLGFYGS